MGKYPQMRINLKKIQTNLYNCGSSLHDGLQWPLPPSNHCVGPSHIKSEWVCTTEWCYVTSEAIIKDTVVFASLRALALVESQLPCCEATHTAFIWLQLHEMPWIGTTQLTPLPDSWPSETVNKCLCFKPFGSNFLHSKW